jgi:hypothetical protein
MAQRKTLTERQIAVLRWIGDGCPDGVMTDESHRISAGALRNRGLVKTSGRGPTWAAAISDAGRAYLEQVDGPNPPVPRHAGGGVAAQLVAAVVAAGGSLRVPRHQYWRQGSVDYQRRVELAIRHDKVPRDKRLMVTSVSPDELQIDLVDAPPGTDVDVMPVPVPEHVRRYHAVVTRFRELSERHEVSRAQLPRTLRVLQGLVVEVEKRGHTVEVAADDVRAVHHRDLRWSGPDHGHLVITVDGCSSSVRVSEDGLQSRAYWARNDDGYAFGPGTGNRRRAGLKEYEAGATGWLRFSIVPTYGRSRQMSWSDGKKQRVEDKLPELLRAIEVRAAEERYHRELAELEAARREQERQAAIERALMQYVEQLRADALASQVADWRRARDIRAYCDAVQAVFVGDPATTDWINWSRAHADAIDPLQQPPRPPTPPDRIRGEDLRPFLRGYEPDYLVSYRP